MSRQFHHIGIITDQVQPNEIFVEATRVNITDPAAHPGRVEYLRYEADSQLTGPVREMPHIAYKVPSLAAEMQGREVVLGPFEAMENVQVVFVMIDGALHEFIEFTGPSDFDLK